MRCLCNAACRVRVVLCTTRFVMSGIVRENSGRIKKSRPRWAPVDASTMKPVRATAGYCMLTDAVSSHEEWCNVC